MKAITLHKIDDDLYEAVVLEAKSRGWSFNKTAKELLGEAIGIKSKKKKYRDFSNLGINIPSLELRRIDEKINQTFEVVDEE